MMGQAARRGAIGIEGAGRRFEVEIASSCDDYEQSFLLLARKYQAKGYEQSGTKLFRFTPFHVLPETITVVAREGSRVAATLSLVPDTTLLGLPMESVYPGELAQFRAEGRRLGEVTCLADEDLSLREFHDVFQAMIRIVLQYHLRIGGDTWVITVNPRHTGFYRKVMAAQPFGDRRSYPSVANAPAEAFFTDASIMREVAPKTFHRMFGTRLPDEVLAPRPRSSDHNRFFGQHSTASDPSTIRRIAEFVEHFGSGTRWSRGDEGEWMCDRGFRNGLQSAA